MTRINASRRAFSRALATAAATGPAAAGLALNMAALGSAAAQSASGYKALVCVFLFGGNDNANTVLATDTTSWNAYVAARGTIAGGGIGLAAPGSADGVLPLAPLHATGGPSAAVNAQRAFALHPSMSGMQRLFDTERRAAIVANVGTLLEPVTRAQFVAKTARLPPNLGSHNDQQSQWMSFANEGARVGWGGRLADLFAANNADATYTAVSVAGNTSFLSGGDVLQYQVGNNGAVRIETLSGTHFGSTTIGNAHRALITASGTHLLERELARIANRSIAARQKVSDAFAATPVALSALPRPDNSLAAQMYTVARLIAARSALGVASRQVFFVSAGASDPHSNLLATNGAIVARVSSAMEYFDRAMGALGLQDHVTAFTASDFGRTFTYNGDGTDHGWGSHHFVVGGAVRGKDIYGRFPELGVGTPDTTNSRGVLLPQISLDQYAAALGRWFGATNTQILDIFPNLASFGSGGTPDALVASALMPVGFMRPG